MPSSRRRRWRSKLRAAAFIVGVLGAILVLGLIPGSQARSHLAAGRSLLEQARSALAAGRADEATLRFEEAEQEFIGASSSARNPVFRLITPLPLLGRTPDAVVAIADAGRSMAEAGKALSGSVAGLPGGLQALAPSNSRLPIERIASLSAGVRQAAVLTEQALDDLNASASSLLLPPVADARTAALAVLSDLSQKFGDASEIVDGLPGFLGADGPRTYLFGAQNPAELRGTGGLMGVFSVLETDEGRLSFTRFQGINSAPYAPPGGVEAPNRDYARIYEQFGAAASWSNGNMTPDLPSAAVAFENHWEEGGGKPVDGVILADPYALAAMLQATGPVEAPSLGITLTADNVVPFVTNQVYSRFTNSTLRKEALGVATQAVLEAFLRGSGSAEADFTALSQSLLGGHIQIYVNDTTLEGALSDLSVGGALDASQGDFLALVQNNGGANKIDYYLDRSVDYSVKLGAEGTAIGTVDVRLDNNAPLKGAPSYVLGPYPGVSRRGENVSLVSLYCSTYCSFTGKTSQGNVDDYGGDIERGLPFTWDYVRIPSGSDASIHYSTAVEGAWQGDQFGGTYRFTFLNQPTIRPTQVSYEIQVPDGMEITSTSVRMRVSGSSAVWEGVPGRELEIEVTFRPSLLRRARLFFWHVLTTPVIKL